MDDDQLKNLNSQFTSFHDIPTIDPTGNIEDQTNIGISSHQPFNNLSNESVGINTVGDQQGLPPPILINPQVTDQQNILMIEYIKSFFDVNTNDVLERLKLSMIPSGRENYFGINIRRHPDLYGPIWISTTLIMSVLISWDMSNYFQSSSLHYLSSNFPLVLYVMIYTVFYLMVVPLILYYVLARNYKKGNEQLIQCDMSRLELFCLYGYSLTIYVPVSFLWIIPINWLQWTLVVVATFLSGGILLRSLLPFIGAKQRIIYTVAILGVHLLFGVLLLLTYLYDLPSKSTGSAVTELISSSTRTNILQNVTQNNS